jgi:hypothetical protein
LQQKNLPQRDRSPYKTIIYVLENSMIMEKIYGSDKVGAE